RSDRLAAREAKRARISGGSGTFPNQTTEDAMRKFAASAAIILALATGCPSQAGESAYTDFPFENKACKPLGPEKSQEEIEMGLVSIVCPGYRDYQVYLDEADLRTSVHYGFLSERVINDYWESFAPFNSVGEKIE